MFRCPFSNAARPSAPPNEWIMGGKLINRQQGQHEPGRHQRQAHVGSRIFSVQVVDRDKEEARRTFSCDESIASDAQHATTSTNRQRATHKGGRPAPAQHIGAQSSRNGCYTQKRTIHSASATTHQSLPDQKRRRRHPAEAQRPQARMKSMMSRIARAQGYRCAHARGWAFSLPLRNRLFHEMCQKTEINSHARGSVICPVNALAATRRRRRGEDFRFRDGPCGRENCGFVSTDAL